MGRRFALLLLGISASLGVYLAMRGGDEEPPDRPKEYDVPAGYVAPPTEPELIQRHLVATLALRPGFPEGLPWASLLDNAERKGYPLENLLQSDPVRFLELCLERQRREVQGYRLTFIKKERIGGHLHPPKKDEYETVEVAFREHPFSVFFKWVANPRVAIAGKVLYVEGENGGKMLARGKSLLAAFGIQTEDVNGAKAKSSGRYTIDEFGLYKATERSIASMRKAQARGELHIRYEGKVKLGEVGDRVCYKFVRTPYYPLEEDKLNELTLYIDAENWLQIGSVLRDPDGNLLAEYFFRDIEINPTFDAKQFTRDSL